MNNDLLIWILNIIIILMFIYMIVNRTYLETNVVIYTMDGKLVLADVYAKNLIEERDEQLFEHLGTLVQINITGDLK